MFFRSKTWRYNDWGIYIDCEKLESAYVIYYIFRFGGLGGVVFSSLDLGLFFFRCEFVFIV